MARKKATAIGQVRVACFRDFICVVVKAPWGTSVYPTDTIGRKWGGMGWRCSGQEVRNIWSVKDGRER